MLQFLRGTDLCFITPELSVGISGDMCSASGDMCSASGDMCSASGDMCSASGVETCAVLVEPSTCTRDKLDSLSLGELKVVLFLEVTVYYQLHVA